MKIKLIALEPYLSVLHSWDVLTSFLEEKNKTLEEIIREKITGYYTGELTYYLNHNIKEGIFLNKNIKTPIEKYTYLFKNSLDYITEFVFGNNGKIKDIQTYKQITQFIEKDILIFAFLKKNNLPLQLLPKEYFYNVPYYINNLRETHMHAGLAFNFIDSLDVILKNFENFSILLSKEKVNKSKEVLERLKLFVILGNLILREENENLYFLIKKFNENLPISHKYIFPKSIDVYKILANSIKFLYDENVSSNLKLTSAVFIVNFNGLLKFNAHNSLYKGLEYFSQTYIRKNPIKIISNKIIKDNGLPVIYKTFFSKEKRVKSFEVRLFPNIQSLKFWHEIIEYLEKETEKNFSLIFHYGKLKKFEDFENIRNFYQKVFKQTKKVINFLKTNPQYTKYFSGIDAASMEYWTPAWLFAPTYSFWRNYAIHYIPELSQKNKEIRFTFHAGEDFVDIGTGFKNIYEAIKFLNLNAGDRIGHGTVLGLDIEKYTLKHRKIKIPPLFYFFNLLWLNFLTYKHQEFSQWKEQILRELYRIINNYDFLRSFIDSITERNSQNQNSSQHDLYLLLVNLYELLRFDFINVGECSKFAEFWNAELNKRFIERKETFDNKIVVKLPNLFLNYRKEKTITKNFKDKNIILDPLLSNKSDLNFEEQLEMLNIIKKIVLSEVERKGILIEACPTSNVYIRDFSDYKEHLIYKLKDEIAKNNIRLTLNTDNPLIFNNTLLDEFMIINETLPKDYRESIISEIIKNSHKFAFGEF